MKHWLFLIAVILTVDGSSQTIINLSGNEWLAISPMTCEQSTPTAAGPCQPCAACPSCPSCSAAVVIPSTGPFVMKSASSADCYRANAVNPNGTITNYPLTWVPCPP